MYLSSFFMSYSSSRPPAPPLRRSSTIYSEELLLRLQPTPKTNRSQSPPPLRLPDPACIFPLFNHGNTYDLPPPPLTALPPSIATGPMSSSNSLAPPTAHNMTATPPSGSELIRSNLTLSVMVENIIDNFYTDIFHANITFLFYIIIKFPLKSILRKLIRNPQLSSAPTASLELDQIPKPSCTSTPTAHLPKS